MMFHRGAKSKGLKVIIVGCGKVGTSVVDQLSREGHDITVIDRDPAVIQTVTNQYDVIGVVGNGASFSTQTEAGVENADVLIAVTHSDELNLLCCVAAKRSSECAVIARVRTPDYSDDSAYFKDKLGLAMIINPEKESARVISRILCLPTALDVSSFSHGLAEMIRIRVPRRHVLDGKKLNELSRELDGAVLVCAVERSGEVYIPDGSFQLLAGDVLTFVCPSRGAKLFLDRLGFRTNQARAVLIVGGSRAGYYLARILLAMGTDVRIIEMKRERCEELSMLLPRATILNGDGTDADVLREAGIDEVDAVVPLMGIDEENILLTLHAQAVSRAKVVTKINRIMFPEAIERLNLDSVVCPKYLTTDAIVAYVRARSASKDFNIETLVHLFDNRVEAIEFLAEEGAPVLNIPLKDLQLKSNLLISCIHRHGSILIPDGNECILAGDSVVVVTKQTGLRELPDILA